MAQSATSSRFESFGRKVDAELGNISPRIEDEVRKVIHHLNDEVVPEVRRSSSSALRKVSHHLTRLAEYLERSTRPKA